MRALLVCLLGSLLPIPFAGAAESLPLRFRIPSDPATLDWSRARSASETYIILNLMEGLVRHDEGLKIAPQLATSWTLSSDGKVYRFQLRPDARWSDGRKLKAQDFVDSWARLKDPKTGSDYATFLSGVEKATALDDGTLEVRLSAPLPYFLHLLTFWVTFPIRADLIARHGVKWTDPRHLVVVGPYRLVSWKPGRGLSLARNAAYSGPARGPALVEVSVDPDEKRARAAFAAGQTDLLLNATTEDLLTGTARSAQFPYLSTYYLGFNQRREVLGKLGVRRALALAIAREEIPAALQGGEIPAQGFVAPGIEGAASAPLLSGTLYDARAALAQAGYNEGVRLPKLELLIAPGYGGKKLAELLQRQWRSKLGVEVEPRLAESAVQFQAALKKGAFDLYVNRWGADFPDAINFLEVFGSATGLNPTGWSSSEYDELLRKNRTALAPDQRIALAREAEKLLVSREAVIAPLFHARNTVLLGPRVERLRLTPLNYFYWSELEWKSSAPQ